MAINRELMVQKTNKKSTELPDQLLPIRWPFVTIIICVFTLGTILTFTSITDAKKSMRQTALLQARMVAESIDQERFKRLTGTLQDEDSPDYWQLHDMFIRIRAIHPDYQYLYLMGKKENQPPFFFMGTSPKGTPEYSPPGQPYPEDAPALARIFETSEETLSDPVTDRWGTWVSALVPLRDRQTGQMIAVFGMDMDASQWNSALIYRALFPGILTLALIFMLIILYLMIRNRQRAKAGSLLLEQNRKLEIQAEEISIQKDRYRLILEATNVGTWEWNIQTGDTVYNNRSLEMLGYGSAELVSKNFYHKEDLLHPEDRITCKEHLDHHLEGKSDYFECESRVRHKDGHWVWILVKGKLISRTPDGKPLVAYGTQQDITERKQEEATRAKLMEQLHQSQKMDAIGQLAGGVAHDFNNLLAGIMGSAQLIQISGNLTQEQNQYLTMILTASEHAGNLTRKLLAFSRSGSKASTSIDCLRTVKDSVEILKRTIDKNIRINFENKATKIQLVGDDTLLQNALINLGINASHAMPQGGEMDFTVENVSLDERDCAASSFAIKPGNFLRISVRDSGSGIASEILPHIFEPFFTTKADGKGTGLGLSMVYGTVQKHGGAITVYSELGVGTVFHIYLPLGEGPAEIREFTEPLPEGSAHILLVDDEELIRITAKGLLESLGYSVTIAVNGEEGFKIMTETDTKIDLVILDMIMPVMGGRETFDRIRQLKPEIPIIIASGFAKEEHLQLLKELGISGFLQKPFRRSELALKVHEALHKKQRIPADQR